jgi:hypothetical protein
MIYYYLIILKKNRDKNMALHKDFPASPHAILDPAIRWFPADDTMTIIEVTV